jgi:hypothetical protein
VLLAVGYGAVAYLGVFQDSGSGLKQPLGVPTSQAA